MGLAIYAQHKDGFIIGDSCLPWSGSHCSVGQMAYPKYGWFCHKTEPFTCHLTHPDLTAIVRELKVWRPTVYAGQTYCNGLEQLSAKSKR